MALDYGERRIGVAVSDPGGRIAHPLETIEHRGDNGLERLAALVSELEIGQIVVGLPLHMDGRAGTQAEKTRAFGDAVLQHTGIDVAYLDERWTTKEAERVLEPARSSRKSRRQRKGRIDPVAASLLLETWLARNAP